ncbi:MAG: hypothetical protein OXU20_04580 [Myxococcales bacterium]|nr:hypothetical protein [Myxococcales bacterium]
MTLVSSRSSRLEGLVAACWAGHALFAAVAIGFGGSGCAAHGMGQPDPGSGERCCDELIVPARLHVTALPGGNGVLELRALTLREGLEALEVYASVTNVGDVHACSAALGIELFDRDGLSLGAAVAGLLTDRFHRVADGSSALAACVGPGEVSMAAATDLPPGLSVQEVAHIEYRCPYFALDVEPIAGLAVAEVARVETNLGSAFTGIVVNGFGAAVQNPAVAVFPVNQAGRPLGVATSRVDRRLPPGGRWAFRTQPIDVMGAGHFAYPTGSLE